MHPIFPIYKLKSDKIYSKFSDIDKKYDILDFGNGFFISSDGIFATAAHILINREGDDTNDYILFDKDLFKIDINNLIKNHIDDEINHVDAAIGKIKLKNPSYFDPLSFERVTQGSTLSVQGFSRILSPEENKNQFNFADEYANNIFKIEAECIDLKYRSQQYFFTIKHQPLFGNKSLKGLSGCPVIDESGIVVGMLKSGQYCGIQYQNILQIHHIDIINKMFLEFKK